jgi:hypothetical protein
MPARTARRCVYCVSCTLNEISETSEIFELQTEGCSSGFLFIDAMQTPNLHEAPISARREFRAPAEAGNHRTQREQTHPGEGGPRIPAVDGGCQGRKPGSFPTLYACEKTRDPVGFRRDPIVVHREAGSPFPREHYRIDARSCASFAVGCKRNAGESQTNANPKSKDVGTPAGAFPCEEPAPIPYQYPDFLASP